MIDKKTLNLYAFIGMFFFSIFIRLPWFFTDSINWDESVYILLGKSMVDGNLPYTRIWENKPPLAFAYYAALQAIVPDSLAFIRLGGSFIVAITAWLVFMSANIFTSIRVSIASGLLSVVAISIYIPQAQCVMLEHIAVVLVMLAIYITLKCESYTKLNCFILGLVYGTAILIRTNLAIVPVLLALFIAITLINKKQQLLNYFVFSSMGSLAMLLLTFAPYALTDNVELFYKTLIKVPIAYVGNNNDTYTHIVIELIKNIFYAPENLGSMRPFVLLNRLIFWSSGVVGVAVILINSFINPNNRIPKFLFVFNLSLFISIVIGKHTFEHYLIQIAPLFCLNIAFLFFACNFQKWLVNCLIVTILSTSALIMSTTSNISYKEIFHSLLNFKAPYHGDAFEISNYVNKNEVQGETLFFTHYTIGYWLTDHYPLVPTVILPFGMLDDNAMVKAFYGNDFSTEDIFKMIFKSNPTRIICIRNQLSFKYGFYPHLKKYLEQYYVEEFSKNQTPSSYVIFVKKN